MEGPIVLSEDWRPIVDIPQPALTAFLHILTNVFLKCLGFLNFYSALPSAFLTSSLPPELPGLEFVGVLFVCFHAFPRQPQVVPPDLSSREWPWTSDLVSTSRLLRIRCCKSEILSRAVRTLKLNFGVCCDCTALLWQEKLTWPGTPVRETTKMLSYFKW